MGGDAYGSIGKQLEMFGDLPGPAVVVFQDADDLAVAAVFGEVMCSTYQAYGSVGLVTNGGGRDLEQVRALKYPVFTGSTICSHGYCHMLHLALPVRVGGLMVYQNDLLHGDANGVTNIPPEIASEVADISDEFIAAEAIMLDYVKAPGEKTVAKFNELTRLRPYAMGWRTIYARSTSQLTSCAKRWPSFNANDQICPTLRIANQRI